MFICPRYRWRKTGSGPIHIFMTYKCLSVQRSGDAKRGLVHFIHKFMEQRNRHPTKPPLSILDCLHSHFCIFAESSADKKWTSHKNHAYLWSVQRTDDAKQGLVHFIHICDKTKSCLSVQRTGNAEQGLVHIIYLWDKKIDIPQKLCLSVQPTSDAKQFLVFFIHLSDKRRSWLSVQRTGDVEQGLVHFIYLWDKNVYLYSVQVMQSRAWSIWSIAYIYGSKNKHLIKIIFICEKYSWRKAKS